MSTGAVVLVGVAIAVGIVGIVVPVLPGSLLVWAAIAIWAWQVGTATSWAAFGIVTVVLALTTAVKYAVPGRRLKDAGVPGRAMLTGTVLGVVGFFVIPVVGLFVGFVLGVYLFELQRQRDQSAAWTSTKHAMKATGLSILIELAGALLAATVWVAAVALS